MFSDDPPFYLRRHSSMDVSSKIDSACAVLSDCSSRSKTRSSDLRRVHPTKSMQSRMGSSGSTSEELRSVIDDLTIKNKKLRQKLKIYDRLHCSHLQNEKLFEVRIHGLPSHKKKEFETTLRGFASSLEAPSSRPSFIPAPLPTSLLSDPLSSIQKNPSSSTSYSKPVDSTYASLSASGQTMNSQSIRHHIKGLERQSQSASSKIRNVKSYLHDMPRGLLPRKSSVMPEKSKQKMVVRRLERIFTGRCAPSSGHKHSLQQQEVSKSAAKADDREGDAGGRVFEGGGMREARILSANTEIPMESPIDSDSCAQSHEKMDGDDPRLGATWPSNDGTPDQRPTRPLDLDLYRAQIPAENMEYIRHLGLASPLADSRFNCDPVYGWVYLNMLTNLAQLHTFSVTPEFIRKSISNLSSRFELSSDGQKIRWKGGIEGTQMSSDSGDSVEPSSDPNDTSDASFNNSSADFGQRAKRRPILLDQLHNGTNLRYRPLFFQGSGSENEDDLFLRNDDSISSSKSVNMMTRAKFPFKGQTLAAGLTSLCQTKQSGPIIYYNQAKFCTDLSGDPNGDLTDHISYNRYFEEPVGQDQRSGLNEPVDPEAGTQGSQESKHSEEGNDARAAKFDLGLEKMNVSDGGDIYDGVAPIYLEASGLGGVQPQDNFIVEVETQYRRSNITMPKVPINRTRVNQNLHNISKSSIDAPRSLNHLPGRNVAHAIETHTISAVTIALPPSVLPEPSYICLPFSSDNEDEEDDSIASSEGNVDKKLPQLTLTDGDGMNEEKQTPSNLLLGWSSDSGERSSYASTSNESDDSSIDLLAHARVLDPDAIAAREREFDINVEQNYMQTSSAENAGGVSEMHSSSSSSPESFERVQPLKKRRRLESEKHS